MEKAEKKARKFTTPHLAVKFVEAKNPDMPLVASLLETCSASNQWANFGPLYDQLVVDYSTHMSLGPELTLTPCANAGIALEMAARALAADAGVPKLRWVGSAFSFKNLGRGYFSDMSFVDCDEQGVMDIGGILALEADSYDGIIVTNPFGLVRDFDRFIAFAKQTGKQLIIDNAAGMACNIPPWPWQVFSLHHTKPYGLGEGGMVLSPDSAAQFLRLLINYDRIPKAPEYWLNNGKISDISCAFLIARLANVATWKPGYLEQRTRIAALFTGAGAASLLPTDGAPVTNSIPVLLPRPLDHARLATLKLGVDIARQYPPLAPLPQVSAIYERLINFPTHPDLSILTDAEILKDIELLLEH